MTVVETASSWAVLFAEVPRTLWDEAAYDWWYEQGEPRLDRFGFRCGEKRQWVWLDDPDNVVRVVS